MRTRTYFRCLLAAALVLLPLYTLRAQDSTAAGGDSLLPADSAAVDTSAPVIPRFTPTEDGFHFSLKSPYHTVLTHLHYLQAGSYHPDTAAITLYVADPASAESQELALQLKQYFEGEGYVIRPENLSMNPNYYDSVEGRQVYYPVPEVRDVYLVKMGRFWVYSQHTVKSIPGLHARVFPFGTLDWIPGWARKKVMWLGIWQWIGLGLYGALSWLIYKVLAWLLGGLLVRVMRRLSGKTVAWDFFRKVSAAVGMLVVILLLRMLIPALQLPVSLNSYVMTALRIGIPVCSVLIFYQMVGLMAAFWAYRAARNESTLDDQLIPLVRRILRIVVVAVGMIFILQAMGVDVTTVLAGLSIGGLALALAAQDTVKNFLGSVMIFVDKPFQVGDYIIGKDVEGTVEEVGMRSTRVRTPVNSVIYVPNSLLADAAVNNMGLRRMRRMRLLLRVPYEVSLDTIGVFVEGCRSLLRADKRVDQTQVDVYFLDINENGQEILWNVYLLVDNFTDEAVIREELLTKALRLGQELGIRFSPPTRMYTADKLSPPEAPDPAELRSKRDQLLARMLPVEEAPAAEKHEHGGGD